MKNNTLFTVLLLFFCVFFVAFGVYAIVQAQAFSTATDITNYEVIKEGYTTAQACFVLAGGGLLILSLLPRLQTIGFGGVSITLRDIEKQVNDIAVQQNVLQEKFVDIGGGKHLTPSTFNEIKSDLIENKLTSTPNHIDDPQKGKWGGEPKSGTRTLSAKVEESIWPGLYSVELKVRSADKNDPLKGMVKFFLHNTFRNPEPVISVQNGEAILKLSMVYGAFTVGALADDGRTQLELDLAQLPNVPDDFKER
jgi:hypothetical protein